MFTLQNILLVKNRLSAHDTQYITGRITSL